MSHVTASTIAGRNLELLELGESGRGRKLVSVSCPKDLKAGDAVSVTGGGVSPQGIKRKTVITAKDDGNSGAWLARICTSGAYIRGANGGASTQPEYGVKVLEMAYGAFGDAGRTGIWRDYLAVVPDSSILRVKPSRGDCYYLLFEAEQVSKLTADELELLGLEYDMDSRVQLQDLQ